MGPCRATSAEGRLVTLDDEPFHQILVVQADQSSPVEDLVQMTEHDSRVAAHLVRLPHRVDVGSTFNTTGRSVSNLTFRDSSVNSSLNNASAVRSPSLTANKKGESARLKATYFAESNSLM